MSGRPRATGWPLLLLLLLAAPLAAQQRIAVLPEPGTPVIATEILLATGPTDEAPARAGIAFLSARAVTRPILPLLDSLDAHLIVSPEKDAIAFSLIAAPDAWDAAIQLLLVALFRDPPSAAAIAREQRAVRDELAGRRSNPADAMEWAADSAFFGADHPWARPVVGSPETIARITVGEVDAFLRENFLPARAVAAVVGPIDDARARAALVEHLGSRPGDLPAPLPPRPAAEQLRRDYNSITTWVSTTFPFPADADPESMRLLAFLVAEELSSGANRRSVYNVRSEVVPRRGGGEVRFTVVIPPGEARHWADRVERVVHEIAERPLLRGSWEPLLRRYRGERLQQLSAPEERAHEAARQLLVLEREPVPVPRIERLTANGVRAAALYLGEPTTVLLGPFLDQDR